MSFKFVVLIAGFGFVACSRDTKYPTPDEVPGIYVNTYKVDVINPEDGEVVGSRTVRDTIFIKRSGDEFEVSNNKWLINDYDEKGWVDSMQGEIDPMPDYVAVFDTKIGVLSPTVKDSNPLLFLEHEKVYWGEARALEYLKVDSQKN